MNRINKPLNSVATPVNHNLARKTCLVLGVPLAMLLSSLVIVQAAHADTKKPEIAATDAKQQAALLLEIRNNLTQKGKYSATEIDGVIAELRNKSVEEIKAIADFAGSRATGAERLVGPGTGQDARDRAGELTGRIGDSSASETATQRGVNDALHPGLNDTQGQDSIGAKNCNACEPTPFLGDKQRTGSKMVNGDGAPPAPAGSVKDIPTKGGGHIYVFKDKSVRIVGSVGSTEYINKNGVLVDRDGGKKEPTPDGVKSNGFTAADVRRVTAMLGSKSEPDPNSDNGGTGGGVNDTKANRTGTLGLYTDSATGTYTSKTEIKEVIRLSVEKLQGPPVIK